MKILWFTWKDMQNPYAGGAEVVNEQLAKRLARDGHEVIFLVRGFAGGGREEMIDGYKVIRVGTYHSVYFEAYKYYKKNLVGWADLVIEEVNTIPFFTNWYIPDRVIPAKAGIQGGQRNMLFFHQLCREIWFFEMGKIKGLVGYILETIYLFLLGNRSVITVSQSTKKDLQKFGFKKEKIRIISEGLEIEPLSFLEETAKAKYVVPTILSLGALRPMKRTEKIIEAFEIAKKTMPDLQLVIAGCTAGAFGSKIKQMIADSQYSSSIQFLGKVSREKKIELMQKSHLLCATSVKEGWGLVVTEANSQGTPAVVYNVDGFRDAVRNEETGYICEKNTPENLAKKIKRALDDRENYERIRTNAWNWSKEINFEKSYADFKRVVVISNKTLTKNQ